MWTRQQVYATGGIPGNLHPKYTYTHGDVILSITHFTEISQTVLDTVAESCADINKLNTLIREINTKYTAPDSSATILTVGRPDLGRFSIEAKSGVTTLKRTVLRLDYSWAFKFEIPGDRDLSPWFIPDDQIVTPNETLEHHSRYYSHITDPTLSIQGAVDMEHKFHDIHRRYTKDEFRGLVDMGRRVRGTWLNSWGSTPDWVLLATEAVLLTYVSDDETTKFSWCYINVCEGKGPYGAIDTVFDQLSPKDGKLSIADVARHVVSECLNLVLGPK